MGTNAHAILCAAGNPPKYPLASATAIVNGASTAATLARTQRLYVVPRLHPMVNGILVNASGGEGTVRVQCRLAQPRLAFLWDHRVFGRVLFPAAGETCGLANTISQVLRVLNQVLDKLANGACRSHSWLTPPRPSDSLRSALLDTTSTDE